MCYLALGVGTHQKHTSRVNMDLITDPIQTRRAVLTWQRPLNRSGSRDRIAVAELAQCERGISFRYFNEDLLNSAYEAGFKGYPGLPLNAEHKPATATDTLMRRVPSRSRPDFREFVETFGLSSQAQFTGLSLLAYTGARSVDDSFGIAETFEGFDPPFRYVFDAAGYRHYRNNALDLALEEPATFKHDPTNPIDPDAVEILRYDGTRLGYVNRIQSQSVRRWLASGSIEAYVFGLNGRPAYPRLFVMADIRPG